MVVPSNAKAAGAQAIASARRTVETKVAELIRRDPQWAANAIDVGLVDRDWLDNPGEFPVRSAAPVEMLQRLLARSVEQRPSALSSLGLSAVQLLAIDRSADGSDPAPSPVTVMFTDLEGFTRYTAEFGDEAAIALLQDHQRVVGPVVRSRGGRVVKRLGDGLMLSFPQPEAAVLAALELLAAAPEPLRLRAGLHVGEAVVTHDDVLGHVVNVAARVTEVAKGGQALVTADVRTLVTDLPQVKFGRVRRTHLKGVPDAMGICRIESAP